MGTFLLLISSIAYFIQWINRWIYEFKFENWTWQTWFLYIAIFFFIGSLFLFFSPFLVEYLKAWLEYRTRKMTDKAQVYELKLKAKIEAEKNKYIKTDA